MARCLPPRPQSATIEDSATAPVRAARIRTFPSCCPYRTTVHLGLCFPRVSPGAILIGSLREPGGAPQFLFRRVPPVPRTWGPGTPRTPTDHERLRPPRPQSATIENSVTTPVAPRASAHLLHAVPTGRRCMWGYAFPGFHPGLYSSAPYGSRAAHRNSCFAGCPRSLAPGDRGHHEPRPTTKSYDLRDPARCSASIKFVRISLIRVRWPSPFENSFGSTTLRCKPCGISRLLEQLKSQTLKLNPLTLKRGGGGYGKNILDTPRISR